MKESGRAKNRINWRVNHKNDCEIQGEVCVCVAEPLAVSDGAGFIICFDRT